jgi:hypothetical protein
MNLAEAFVANISRRTFLSLWSYPNPIGKGRKELFDLLVVCDPCIFIFSVKHIIITPSGDNSLDAARWKKRAVEESVKQLYGAERFINRTKEIIACDGKTSISLPQKDDSRISG